MVIENEDVKLSDLDNTINHTPEEFGFKQGVPSEQSIEFGLVELRKCYDALNILLDRYLDIEEKYRKVIVLWIIGTYMHKDFETYPFLFINAMRGSGKTRLLKFLESVVKDGKITNNLSEAVLFRTAENNTILIDEFEGIRNKERSALRELLQSGYKKGSKVERMKKSYSKDGEDMVVESFNVYTPVAMANIAGVDETLGDRCIMVILEKSADDSKTKLIEDFSKNPYFDDIKRTLERFSVVSVGVDPQKKVYMWNKYIYTLYTHTTLTTLTTLPTLSLHQKKSKEEITLTKAVHELFKRINNVGLNGRNLELFFPLFIISELLGEDVLEEILQISQDIIGEKRKEEFTQSLDVSLIDFISRKPSEIKYWAIKDLAHDFKMFVDAEDADEINNLWLGNALKRLKLYTDKRRLGHGVEVLLDISKAQEKIKMFKGVESE